MFLQRFFFYFATIAKIFLCASTVSSLRNNSSSTYKLSPVVSSRGLLLLAVVLRVFTIELFVPNSVVKNEQIQSYQRSY